MATTGAAATTEIGNPEYKQPRSIFDLTADFFDSCRLSNPSETQSAFGPPKTFDPEEAEEDKSSKDGVILDRWTCNTCKIEFLSLQDQRYHFKSDIHRLNVQISLFRLNYSSNYMEKKSVTISFSNALMWLL
jgi:hypothetical protein